MNLEELVRHVFDGVTLKEAPSSTWWDTTSVSLLNQTNKCCTDKNTIHSYFNSYDKLFSPIKDRAKNILEIGIHAGGSIKLWHDYFVNANIYAVDITECLTGSWLNNYERIKTYQTNAYSPDFLMHEFIQKNIKFDVIIEDGPHSLETQQFVASVYSNILSDQGIIVIEDVMVENVQPIVDSFPKHLQSNVEVIDLRGVKNRRDDILIVCDKSKRRFEGKMKE